MSNIWIESLEKKYRFEYKGLISTEDLFDLNLDELDMIYRSLKREEKDLQSDSLLDNTDNPQINELATKIEVVKSIFEIKDAQIKLREEEIIRKARKDKILSIIEDKQDQELSEKSIEELKNIYDEL